MSSKIKNISSEILEKLTMAKAKIDPVISFLEEKNNYGQFYFYEYERTNLVLLTQNLILQKQVILEIFELRNPEYFVHKQIDGCLISQNLIQNFQIDEFDLQYYLRIRKQNLKQINRIIQSNQSSLSLVKQIEDSFVYNKNIKDFIIENDIQYCVSVESVFLNLSQNQIDRQAFEQLTKSISSWNQIQNLVLHLNANKLNYEQMSEFSKTMVNLVGLTNLTLNLSENQIGSKGLAFLVSGMSQLQLKTLNLHLRENEIGSKGASALGQFFEKQSQLNNLFLNLSFNQIQSDGMDDITQGVSKCSQIQHLNINLQNNKIRQLKEFSENIITLKELKCLDIQLQNNKINEEESSYLAQILTELPKTSTDISLSQKSLICFSQIPENDYDQSIILEQTCPQFISSFGDKLSSLTSIQSLQIKLKNCELGEVGINDLGKGLMGCNSLSNLMIEIKYKSRDQKLSSDEQKSLLSIIKCTNITKIIVKVSDLKIEINSSQKKCYELKFISIDYALFKELCDNIRIFDQFTILKFNFKFCKIGEDGIIYISQQLAQLKNLIRLEIAAMISDVGQRGIIQFLKKIYPIKNISKLAFFYYGKTLSFSEKRVYTKVAMKAPHLVDFCFTD